MTGKFPADVARAAERRLTEAEKKMLRGPRRSAVLIDDEEIILPMVSHDEANKRLAIRWALVALVTDLDERAARDRAAACKANGWRMSDASDLYDRTIRDVTGLVEGTIDAQDFLAAASAPREDEGATADVAKPPRGRRSSALLTEAQIQADAEEARERLAEAFHKRTGRCLGLRHVDCWTVEILHANGSHEHCLPASMSSECEALSTFVPLRERYGLTKPEDEDE